MNYRKHNDMNLENALTLEERYKLMPDVAVTDGEQAIRGWLKRNTPLTMDDYTTMLALRGYDMNRYAWCLETDDVPVNGQLPWERVLDEILKHVDGIDSPANGDYATFIMPFVKYAMRHILDTAIRGPLMWNEDACVEACATALSGRLLQIALKTLVWVFRRDEEQGNEERYSPGMPDKDLYMGQGGICLLMAQLAHENGDIRLKTLADYCRRSLVGVRAANATPSAFSGMMSQVYVAMRLDRICGNPQVNDYLKRAAHDFPMLVNDITARLTSETTIGEGVPSSVNLDYLTGASGAMALYLRLQNMYGNDSLRNPLCKLADTVMDSATRLWADTVNDDVETFPSGAAHGMEGMAVTFWRLFRRMGERRYGEFAHDLWRHAMGRRGAQGERSGIKWCRGDIGVLWAQNELESVNGPENEPFFNTDTPPAYQDKEGIGRLLESARWTDDTVCHGRCGAIDTLVSMYHTHQDDWYLCQARGLLDDMVAEAKQAGHFRLGRIPEFVDSSYFLGPVGIAYTMLRVQDPSIPSILALEIGEQEQDNE